MYFSQLYWSLQSVYSVMRHIIFITFIPVSYTHLKSHIFRLFHKYKGRFIIRFLSRINPISVSKVDQSLQIPQFPLLLFLSDQFKNRPEIGSAPSLYGYLLHIFFPFFLWMDHLVPLNTTVTLDNICLLYTSSKNSCFHTYHKNKNIQPYKKNGQIQWPPHELLHGSLEFQFFIHKFILTYKSSGTFYIVTGKIRLCQIV